MGRAIQTCQCEKKPLEIGNVSVQLRSAARRHRPRVPAITEAGVSSAILRSAASSGIATICLSQDCSPPPAIPLDPAPVQAGCHTPPILFPYIPSLPCPPPPPPPTPTT